MLTKEKFVEMMQHGTILLTSTFTGNLYTVKKSDTFEPYFVITLSKGSEKVEYKTDEIIQSINDQFFKFQFI